MGNGHRDGGAGNGTKLRQAMGEQAFEAGRFKEAREVFEQATLADESVEFLTLPAYELLDHGR